MQSRLSEPLFPQGDIEEIQSYKYFLECMLKLDFVATAECCVAPAPHGLHLYFNPTFMMYL